MAKIGTRRRSTDLRDFACPRCRHRSLAVVVGVGRGPVGSPRANVALTLSLARCPGCGARDPVAVGGFWARRFVAMIGAAVVVWATGGALAMWSQDPLYLWVFGPLGFAVAPGLVYLESWKWTTVDRRVVFFDADVLLPAGVLSPPASLVPGRFR